MRILLSCGAKTDRLLGNIERKFQSSGDEFLVVNFMTDIDAVYSKGDYFDKVLLTEQSITKEKQITDEYEIRHRLNQFAQDMKLRNRKVTFTFLVTTESLANMIQEECLPIETVSAIVIKQPPYAVTFISNLLITDIDQYPEDIVYKPAPEIGVDDAILKDTDDAVFDDMNIDDNYTVQSAPSNMSSIIDGNDLGINIDDPFAGINDPFGFDESFGDDTQTDSDVPSIDDLPDATQPVEEEFPEMEDDVPDYVPNTDNNRVDNFESDESLELEDFDPLETSSGSNPEFDNSNDMYQDNMYSQQDTYQDDYQETQDYVPEEQYETNEPIPGFDDVEDNQMYNDYTPDQNDRIDDYSGQGDNFDNQDLYNNDAQDLYNNDQDLYTNDAQDLYSNDAQGLYNEQDMYQPQEDNQMNVDAVIYGNEAMQSNPVQDQEDQEVDIYKMQEDQIKQEAMLAHQNEMLNNQPQQAGKKSRFPFGRKKQQDQPQPQPMVSNVMPNMVPNMGQQPQSNGAVTAAKVRKDLQPFAARGNNIVVTGCGGCGTSTIAYSLANIINQLGFTVLLIDFDTEGRAQNYISRANYESMEPEGANLMAAVNSSTNFQSHVSVVRSGFHLLTMGLGSDVAPVSEMLQEDRIQRFLNLAKSSSHFIIYDVPFNSAKGFLKDVTYRADNLVLTVDASNWGVTKTMLSVCNIEENDMQDVMFNKAQIVFNKYRNLNTVFGKPVKTGADIEKAMDRKVIELLGEDPGFHFSDMHIAGIINDDPDFEKGWFADVAYAETKKGQDIFLKLIDNIVLKKS